MTISIETKQLMHNRAGYGCEYCLLAQIDSPGIPLHIEHVISKKHRGSDLEDSLALACMVAIFIRDRTSAELIPTLDKSRHSFIRACSAGMIIVNKLGS